MILFQEKEGLLAILWLESQSGLREMIGGLSLRLLFAVLFHSAKEEQSSDVLARVPSRKHVCAVVDGLQVDSR